MILNVAAYHFVRIDDPDALAGTLRERAEAAELRGTVLVAEEGVNLFLAGAEDVLKGYLDALRADPRFADLQAKLSHSRAQPFDRLKVKRKSEIVTFRRDGATPLPQRAPTVSPERLAAWLDQGHDDDGRRVVLLDTRNREEIGYGAFAGALTLPIDNFVDLPEALAPHRAELADATVVSYCTGGIRCEKAALWLREDGMDNLLQLDGGILGYFERVGGRHYDGRCFVFDQRVALDAQLQPLVDGATG
ncbi:sulfurtransferase [Lysobacter silvisoli]|uniref:Sulfurtransferase n=1 Tax=Lysobacter silvisoli TaxID=2293254 RepID=A0A371K2Z0_9GAMM|nr:sulfurtransferase [Lysobacter silvisoli]RDZ28230.1 sulfurtransferase [Lysobacter silvisoli]